MSPAREPSGGEEFDLRTAVVRDAVPRLVVDYYTVVQPDRAQFLFCAVATDDYATIELEADGRTVAPSDPPTNPVVEGDQVSPYAPDNPKGWVTYDLPELEAESAALVAGSTRRELSDDVAAALRETPDFRVESVTREDQCAAFTVKNAGDGAGRFVGAAENGVAGTYETVRIAPGERRPLKVCVEIPDAERVVSWAMWPGGSRDFARPIATATPTPGG